MVWPKISAAVGVVAEGDRPFGHVVASAPSEVSELVEEQVQRAEHRALDVPVGLLGKEPEVDEIDERPVERGCDGLTFGGVHSGDPPGRRSRTMTSSGRSRIPQCA